MTATTTTAALVPIQPAFSDAERLALAGFLAGYRGLAREAYALDLRQFTSWCRTRSLSLFAVRRAGSALDAEQIITYCGAGAAAASLAHVLVRLGHPCVAVYDGGLLEWCADRRLPLELGA